jgi:MerR family copper efflux transcriptional regulator
VERPEPPQGARTAAQYQIGDVAELTGLSLRTIRHYEEVGVVVPSGRSPGGFRLYTQHEVDKLRQVMGMKPLGFTLEEISDVLDLLAVAETDQATDEVWARLEMYAELALERQLKYERKLALAAEFTSGLRTLAFQPRPER